MPNIVGADTILEGDLPDYAANYSSLAAYAAKTEEDWNDELTDAETTRWGGLLDGLFDGLEQGKPFIVALFEAFIHTIFDNVVESFENTGETFASMASNFNGKWRDILAAKDAADYANAQLAVSTRIIKDLFDDAEGDLSADWDIDYFDSVGGLAGGQVQQDGSGNAWWDGFGIAAKGAFCRFNTTATTTDDQTMTAVMPLAVQAPAPLTGQSHLRLLGRVNATNDDYVYAEITDDSVSIGYAISGSETECASTSTATQDGDVWDFTLEGTVFTLERNGVQVLIYDDTGAASAVGATHRYVGFEMFAASRGVLGQTSPGTMAVFSADDY